MMSPVSFLTVLRKVRPDSAQIDWRRLADYLKSIATADMSFKGPLGAIAVLVLGLGFGVGLLVMEADDVAGLKLERDAKTDQLDVLNKKQPLSRFSGNEGAQDMREPFVLATTKTLAAAEVDRLLRAAVIEAGGSLLSSRVEGVAEAGGLIPHQGKGQERRIAAELVIEGKIEAIQALLFKLETDAPYFFVEALNVQPVQIGEGTSASPLLRATLSTAAYWRNPT